MYSFKYILANFFYFRVVRYLFVGGMAAVTDISMFAIFMHYFDMGIISASLIAFIFAVLVNYYLGILITFNSKVRFTVNQEFLLVFGVSASGLLFNIFFVYMFVDVMGTAPVLAKIIAAVPTFAWNYTLRRNYVFKKVEQIVE